MYPFSISRSSPRPVVILLFLLFTNECSLAQQTSAGYEEKRDAAIAAAKRQDYARAERLWREAVAQAETFGKTDERLLSSLEGLGRVLVLRGKYREAEGLFRRVLRVREDQSGPLHLQVARALEDLGSVAYSEGSEVQSLAAATRGEGLLGSRMVGNAPQLARQARELMAQAQASLVEAERLFRRAVEIREAAQGHEHPDLFEAVGHLAEINRSVGKLKEAGPYFDWASALEAKFPSIERAEAAVFHLYLARYYCDRKEFNRADETYQKVLAAAVAGEAGDLWEVSIRMELADFYALQEKWEQADQHLLRAIFATEVKDGMEALPLASVLRSHATVLKKLGRMEEARKSEKRARDIAKKHGVYVP